MYLRSSSQSLLDWNVESAIYLSGWESSLGYYTSATMGWSSSMRATTIMFSLCLCICTSRVHNPLATRKESMGFREVDISFCALYTPCRKGSDLAVTDPASMSECPPIYLVFMAYLTMISCLWDVFHTTVFLVPQFVIMIFKKINGLILFLYTIASIYFQYLCFYFKLS